MLTYGVKVSIEGVFLKIVPFAYIVGNLDGNKKTTFTLFH
jgi:hypothetical protein